MSVPVVAPQLYDVILRNLSENEKPEVYVTVLAQEIQLSTLNGRY